tara:strand:- start:684 stop:803 length:120 start_codon:yes stop_codon:yes gene_type:complete
MVDPIDEILFRISFKFAILWSLGVSNSFLAASYQYELLI